MLQHLIFLRYHAGTSADHIAAFCERMLALRGAIDEIRSLEIGRDELHDARSWDLVLIMAFESVSTRCARISGTRRTKRDGVQRPVRRGCRVRRFHS
jgi:hypothetical protein